MLVLSREVGQKIRVGKDVLITVTRIGRGKVRIGFEAPVEIPIVRTELEESEPWRKYRAGGESEA